MPYSDRRGACGEYEYDHRTAFKADGEYGRNEALSFEELLYEDNLDESISASSETADAKMYEREKKQVIADAVATLPEKEKQVVTMYYYERLKYSEIAKVMSITQSRVCQIHSKAMLTLKNKLESYING